MKNRLYPKPWRRGSGLNLPGLFFAGLLGSVLTSGADFRLVDEFGAYATGTITTVESPWRAHRASGTSFILAEPGNQFLGFGWQDQAGYRSVSRLLPVHLGVEPSETATLFYRFRLDASNIRDSNFGLAVDPDTTDHAPLDSFRVQAGIRGDGVEPSRFGVWDGADFRELIPELEVGVWYNIWKVINRDAGTFQVYVKTGQDGATSSDRLSDGPTDAFAFRSGGQASETFNAFLGAGNRGGGSAGRMHLDNIWIDKSGENLDFVSLDSFPGAALAPFTTIYGSEGGRDGGEGLVKNDPAVWSIQPEGLRVQAGPSVDSLAAVNVVNRVPGSGFATRSQITLVQAGSSGADHSVGLTVLGSGGPGEAGTLYHAQWIPDGANGSRIRLLQGVDGTVLAQEVWTGLRPSAQAPSAGVGTTYDLLAYLEDKAGEASVLSFRLTDEAGHSQTISTSLVDPLDGNWMGIAARNASGTGPVWDVLSLAVVDLESWQIDYRGLNAPLALNFGQSGGSVDGSDLLRNRQDALTLLSDALRLAGIGNDLFTATALASVENYINRQDFVVQSEITLAAMPNGDLQRVGLVVLGGPHIPIESSFDADKSSDYYSLVWYPAYFNAEQDIVSRIEIREGLTGTLLAQEIWGGLHPSIDNFGQGGIGNRYSLKATGSYDDVGGLALDFTLSDSVVTGQGFSQTISTYLPSPFQGNLFGFGGRVREIDSSSIPAFDFHTLSLTLGAEPGEEVFDPALTGPFAVRFGNALDRDPATDFLLDPAADWSLETTGLRVESTAGEARNAVATTRVFNFQVGGDFFLRARFLHQGTVPSSADSRVGLVLFGEADRAVFDPAGDSGFYSLQWIPVSAGGGSLVLRQGMTGGEVSRVDFQSLAQPPQVSAGTPYEMYFHARYNEGSELDFVAILVDAGGREAILTGTMPIPPEGNRFGFGARHAAGTTPGWSLDELVWTSAPQRPDRTVAGIPFSIYGNPGLNPGGTSASAIGRYNYVDPDTGETRYPESPASTSSSEFIYRANSFVGNAGNSPNAQMHSTILFFTLPELAEGEAIDYAELSVVRIDASRNSGPGNVDLYGIGFSSGNSIESTLWFTGPDDETAGVVKLQENFVVGSDPGGRLAASIDANESLTTWLGSLYANGAQAGDFAILRLSYNVDRSPNSGNTERFVFATPTNGEGNDDPVLTLYRVGGEVPGATFSAWREDNFGPADLLDESVSGANAAPAGDGVSNLLKYAFGLLAMTPVSGDQLPQVQLLGNALVLEYPENKDALDLVYLPQGSADLDLWNLAGIVEIDRADHPEMEGFALVTVALDVEGLPRAFLRIQVEQTQP